jgi:hypothetical protein
MRIVKTLIAIAAVLALLVVGQVTASAHEDYNWDGRDYASVSSDHEGALVCDNERDGHLVTALFQLDTGESVVASDDDGANGSCQLLQFSPDKIVEFGVCETGNACDMEFP